MPSFLLRGGLWLSFAVVVVAVYLGLQGPLQQVFTSTTVQTFCYSTGVTTRFSTQDTAACFTVEDGHFVQVFTPATEHVELRPGHAIPGLWDGVRDRGRSRCKSGTNYEVAWPLGPIWRVPSLRGSLWLQVSQRRQRPPGGLRVGTRGRGFQRKLDQRCGMGPDGYGGDANRGMYTLKGTCTWLLTVSFRQVHACRLRRALHYAGPR